MITDKDMAAKSRKLRGLMQQKLDVRGRDLRQSLRRAGRRLPRGVRKRGADMMRAEVLANNPKTARQVDIAEVDAAYDYMWNYLDGLDVADMRRGRILSLTSAIAANLLLVCLLFVIWLWWRGYV
jgi:hypothetical protein